MNDDSNSNELNVQIYSIRPIGLDVGFTIPGDPYTDGEARKYLKDLGVLFYRDEYNTSGMVFHQDVEYPIRIAYYSQGIFDREEMQISQWDEGSKAGQDTWIMHNDVVSLSEVTPSGVKRIG